MFKDAFPTYLVMGMTDEQFWDGDPYLATAYRSAYKLKRQEENENAWLQGVYFCDAISVCLSNAFSKSGSKKHTYIDKPIDIYPPSKEELERREEAEYKKMEKAMQSMIRAQKAQKKQGG